MSPRLMRSHKWQMQALGLETATGIGKQDEKARRTAKKTAAAATTTLFRRSGSNRIKFYGGHLFQVYLPEDFIT